MFYSLFFWCVASLSLFCSFNATLNWTELGPYNNESSFYPNKKKTNSIFLLFFSLRFEFEFSVSSSSSSSFHPTSNIITMQWQTVVASSTSFRCVRVSNTNFPKNSETAICISDELSARSQNQKSQRNKLSHQKREFIIRNFSTTTTTYTATLFARSQYIYFRVGNKAKNYFCFALFLFVFLLCYFSNACACFHYFVRPLELSHSH